MAALSQEKLDVGTCYNEGITTHVDHLLQTYDYRCVHSEKWPDTESIPRKLEEYYIGKTYIDKGEPAHWYKKKKEYDIMLVVYETKDEKEALEKKAAIVTNRSNDKRMRNEKDSGNQSSSTKPGGYVVYMCLKYQDIFKYFATIATTAPPTPLRRKALEALRSKIDKLLREEPNQLFHIGITCGTHKELKDLKEKHSLALAYVLTNVTQDCVPEGAIPDSDVLTYQYTLSLKQELVFHYQFEKPNSYIAPMPSTEDMDMAKRCYKLMLFTK